MAKAAARDFALRNAVALAGGIEIVDTASFAARVEALARDGDVLMTESTCQLVRARMHARLWGVAPTRGKTGTYNIYEVLGLVDGPMVPGERAVGVVPG